MEARILCVYIDCMIGWLSIARVKYDIILFDNQKIEKIVISICIENKRFEFVNLKNILQKKTKWIVMENYINRNNLFENGHIPYTKT